MIIQYFVECEQSKNELAEQPNLTTSQWNTQPVVENKLAEKESVSTECDSCCCTK